MKKAKSTPIARPMKHPVIVLSDSKMQQQKLGKPTRSSTRSDPRSHSIWEKANPNYVYGEPLLSEIELEKAGPCCVTLHAWYMKECVEGRTKGPSAKYKKEHF